VDDQAAVAAPVDGELDEPPPDESPEPEDPESVDAFVVSFAGFSVEESVEVPLSRGFGALPLERLSVL
jgi:hypothetical protein